MNDFESQPQAKDDPLAFFKRIRWSEISLPKLLLLSAVGILVLAIIITLVRTTLMGTLGVSTSGVPSVGGGKAGMQYLGDADDGYDMAYEESPARAPSVNTTMPAPEPRPDYVPGVDAEDFEIKDYQLHYRTSDFNETCEAVEALKPREDVIFESASSGEASCYYRFKVANESVAEVLATLESLDPESIDEQTTTIKRQLENNLNQLEILENNLTSIETILDEAVASYDQLTAIATNAGNADALSKSIAEKIRLIDQLRQRRESTRAQIDALNRMMAEQQDRLEYTYFSVSVSEVTYIDGDAIKSSWQRAMQRFVNDFNDVLQQLTLGFLMFVVQVLMFLLFALFVVCVAKFGWKIVRRIWQW